MKALVVLPTFSEAENLPTVIEAIWRRCPELHIAIVDDDSPDGTGEIADKLHDRYGDKLCVLHRGRREGLGRAYLDAFRVYSSQEYDAILQMDADLSHDPSFLPALLKAAESADLVLGSRYLHGVSVVNWDFKRLMLSLAASHYVRWLTRMPFTDPTGGYKCWQVSVLRRLLQEEVCANGFFFQIEMTWLAWSRGFRVQEVPIVFYERRQGRSKIGFNVVCEALIGVIRLSSRQFRKRFRNLFSSPTEKIPISKNS
jgi:dolichol-phosphate mannosyltransferase